MEGDEGGCGEDYSVVGMKGRWGNMGLSWGQEGSNRDIEVQLTQVFLSLKSTY